MFSWNDLLAQWPLIVGVLLAANLFMAAVYVKTLVKHLDYLLLHTITFPWATMIAGIALVVYGAIGGVSTLRMGRSPDTTAVTMSAPEEIAMRVRNFMSRSDGKSPTGESGDKAFAEVYKLMEQEERKKYQDKLSQVNQRYESELADKGQPVYPSFDYPPTWAAGMCLFVGICLFVVGTNCIDPNADASRT